MSKLEWSKLLTEIRRKDIEKEDGSKVNAAGARTEIERDYDRILFSTPVRRLSDKTQVFPLEKHDSVRTRLTHSHEVSNIARSIGVALCYDKKLFDNIEKSQRNIPSILAAVGLAHDIGNPPFGHQGEVAIGSWFNKNKVLVFESDKNATNQMIEDYLNFEGNAQALRILTRLQILNDNYGLNLTCGSIAALMKYPISSDKIDNKNKATKKFGYFFSEKDVCKQVWEITGLTEGIRHPLTYVMEASDDIAYTVLDAEDSIKKCLVSYRDLISHLDMHKENDPLVTRVIEKSENLHNTYIKENLSPTELNDVSTQMFRVAAIGELVTATIESFVHNYDKIITGTFKEDLISVSAGALFSKILRSFSKKFAYKHKSVLELELRGHKVIHSLMDMLWPAIEKRGDPLVDQKHKGDPFEQYAYSRISENYKRIFEDKDNKLPLSYKRAQLLGDMISGMTDSFAIDFEEELQKLRL